MKQLWLFHVGKDEESDAILPEDELYCFDRDTGIRFKEDKFDFVANQEQISGSVIAKPGSDESPRLTALDSIPAVFMEFAEGTISFFRKHFGI